MNEKTLPIVIFKTVRKDGSVTIVCPYCKDSHIHSATPEGVRASHCFPGGNYIIRKEKPNE